LATYKVTVYESDEKGKKVELFADEYTNKGTAQAVARALTNLTPDNGEVKCEKIGKTSEIDY